ncbi:MAG: PilZ domain-containing protein [Spirochaeta sp.]
MDTHGIFYEGFAPSLLETALFFALLGLFFIVLPGLAALRMYLVRRKKRERAKRYFASRLQEMGLSTRDRELLVTLSAYLKDPERVYLLLENQGIFDACIRQALADGAVGEEQISRLRIKIGYGGQRTGTRINSSTQIPPGSSVILLKNKTLLAQGNVQEQKPESLRLQTGEIPGALEPGTSITVVYQDTSGVYEMSTTVQRTAGSTVDLDHTEHVGRLQRRRHFRAPVHLPVYVKPVGTIQPAEYTRFIDLGGGGGSIENPARRYRRGDYVALSFSRDSEEAMNTVGEVVRTSRGHAIAHIDFRTLTREAQDRLYGILFQQEK